MLTLLIVEDERWEREGLVSMVRNGPNPFLNIIAAQDGVEGLKAIRTHQPDIIVTDVKMPGLSGLEMLSAASKWTSDCVCIILSGYSEFEYARRAMKIGAVDYLLKPVVEQDLHDALRRGSVMLSKTRGERAETPDAAGVSLLPQIDWNTLGETEAYVLRRTLDLIHSDYMDADLNLRLVADKVYLSPNYVGALFKRLSGQSFNDYLHQHRLKMAAHFILEPGRKIAWIAKRVGIPNTSYFCVLFKSFYGLTPSQYRRGAEE